MFRAHPNFERVRLNKRAQNHPRLDDGMPISVKPYWTRVKQFKVLSLHPKIIEGLRHQGGLAFYKFLTACPSLEELDICPSSTELASTA